MDLPSHAAFMQDVRTAELFYEHAAHKDESSKEHFIEDLSAVVRKYRGEPNEPLNLSKVGRKYRGEPDEPLNLSKVGY